MPWGPPKPQKSPNRPNLPDYIQLTMDPELPPEMWVRVLGFCATPDLCLVAQVSRQMNEIATDPVLWADRGKDIDINKVRAEGVAFLAIPRFRNLKALGLSSLGAVEEAVWSQVLEYVESSGFLMSLDFSGNNIPTDILNRLLQICSKLPSLNEIKLKNVGISKVAPHLLAQATSNLANVDLQNCHLTEEQCMIILTGILTMDLKNVKNLNLGDANLSRIPANLVASAVSIIETVTLANTKLVNRQMIAILKQLLNPITKLLHLSLEDVNLSNELDPFDQSVITPQLFSSAICRLKSVNLRQTYLTTQLINALLTEIITGPSKLSSINLRHVQRTHVPSELLGEALSSLQQVSLSYIRSSEMDTLLMYFANSQSLQELDLENVFFGYANVQLTARAICRLQKVNLKNARLTLNHLTSLFTAMVARTSLKEINLQGVNLIMVPEKLLAAAISRVSTANLTKTNLAAKHIKALCDASQSETSTVKHVQILDISGQEANAQSTDPPACPCLQKGTCIFAHQMPRLDKKHKMDLLKNALIIIGIFLLLIFLILVPILELLL